MTGNIDTEYKGLTKDIEICHNKNEVPFIFVPHLHSHYEIYYNISGAKGYMVNGNFYKCGSRDLIVIPKVQAHKVLVKPNVEYERCIINIDESVLQLVDMLCHGSESISWLKQEQDAPPCAATLTIEEHEQFLEMIERYNSLEEREEKLLTVSLFLEILDFIGGVLKNRKANEYLNEDRLSYADQAMKMIELQFKTATVADIADNISVNKDYLNRFFKEETGMTVSQYLILRKLTEAKKHLYLGKSAKEACILSGFHNYANFTRTFKKHEGCSPKEFGDIM